MDPTWQMIFFGLAILLVAAYAILEGCHAPIMTNRLWMFPAGLALFIVPFFWAALKAA